MFGRSVRQRVIAHSPFDGVNLADEPQRTFPPFWTTEQYLKFIAGIETQRQRVGFGLAFYAGLCARECVTLRWENLGRDHIHVVNREHARTQGDRSRKVPLYEPLRKEIDRLPNIGAYVLSSEYNEISDERSLSQKFLKYRRRIATLPEISFHGLRHSFATGCAFRGMPLPVLHKIMGHANISTTAMYLHVQEDAAVDTAHKFAPQLPTIF
jgi:integrase